VLPFEVAADFFELVDKEQSKNDEGNENKRKNDVENKRELHWNRPQTINLLSVFHISFRLSRLKWIKMGLEVIQTVRDHKISDTRLKPKIKGEGQTEKEMRTL
jgi:hypothetical protein